MNQAELLRLAEVGKVNCTLKSFADGSSKLTIPDSSNPFAGRGSKIWNPYEDLNQALLCLEGLKRDYTVDRDHILELFEVCIELPHLNSMRVISVESDLKTAICKAVLEAAK
jgi:hypothetical protein